MRAINLLLQESRAGQTFAAGLDRLVAGGAALTAVVAIVVGGGFVIEHSHASSAQRQLDAARAQLAQVTAHRSAHTGTPVVPTPAVVAQIAPWQTAVDTALSTRVAYDIVLAQLGRLIPANVTLSTVSLGGTTGTAAPTAGSAGALSIGGTAFTEDGVAQLLARLALIPQATGVTLTSSSADPKTGIVTFLVSAQMKGASAGFTTTTTSGAGG